MREQLNQKSIKYNWHEVEVSVMEGILARGDRKLCKVILDAYNDGCIYDAWSEFFDYDKWMNALEKNGINYHFYTDRERDKDEILPWDYIDIGVTKDFLWREYENAKAEKVTPNCAMKCSGCGAGSYKAGICVNRTAK